MLLIKLMLLLLLKTMRTRSIGVRSLCNNFTHLLSGLLRKRNIRTKNICQQATVINNIWFRYHQTHIMHFIHTLHTHGSTHTRSIHTRSPYSYTPYICSLSLLLKLFLNHIILSSAKTKRGNKPTRTTKNKRIVGSL